MTTPSTDADHLRWWQWIGPWPLRPGALGVISAVFALATTSFSLTTSTAARTIGAALAVGCVTAATLWTAERFASGLVGRFPGYLVAVALASMTATAVREATGTILEFPNIAPEANLLFSWLRGIPFACLFLALLGISQRRLRRQVDRADAALALARAQADALLTADEEVRHQVSLLLHDRVQAGLIAACLQLRRTLSGDDERDAQVTRVVDQLEQLRALDVRRAVHALSPNLREVDLATAIDDLADTYRPAMQVEVTIADGVAVPERLRLGIYRIVEQGLMNAAVHGSASTCSVALGASDGTLRLRVIDDGAGMSSDARPGFGSTLIDTWCRVLGGTWSTRPGARPGTDILGTEVRVTIPFP